MSGPSKQIEVYRVTRVSTKHGEHHYDDNSSYVQDGDYESVCPGLYQTREAAQHRADALNANINSEFDDFMGGPFTQIDDEEESTTRDGWNSRMLFPWPVFCDWLADRRLPRPLIDGVDTDGQVVPRESPEKIQEYLNGEPPALHVMRDWWGSDRSEGDGLCDLPDPDAARALIKQVVPGPKLYVVEVVGMDRVDLERMADDLTAVRGYDVQAVIAAAQSIARTLDTAGQSRLNDVTDATFWAEVQLILDSIAPE